MQENTHKPSALFLIGMMASGKSTVGKALAARLGWDFFDVDREVERRTGVTVAEIFEKEGEAGFRRRETEMMAELTIRPGCIVAMGGGAPLFEVNRKLLKRGLVVRLLSTVSDVLERTRFDTTRPLLRSEDPVAKIRELMLAREPVYAEVSDVEVSTTRTHPEVVADRILAMKEVQDVVREAEKRLGKDKREKQS
ncbi:shikimate kinase [Duodenibacillus massiliensis]|jgi:shikimate kinase|uniref:shikimate kinase n=1 Tax=Duodenibacillus massiliensis TaxID=1852381 RepID=UPI00033FD519|nr:shikimate kinase [Duodenibacillus massiliensis]MBE5701183.1 shikimate kinase [Sutterella sp.]MBS1386102.1 shikimate kinase [Duodenibacillus sp.]CDD69945.1 shikimate kinase [Sutterella sp. CAG:397]MBS5792580.1 shikimate kinase [Sutterella sp.]HAF65690.1 shikimate kinase [Sutterella sp.]